MRNKILLFISVIMGWCACAFTQSTPPSDPNKDLPVVRSAMAQSGSIKITFQPATQQTALDSAAFTVNYTGLQYKFTGLLARGYFFEKQTGNSGPDGPAFFIAIPEEDEARALKDDLQNLSQDKCRDHIEQLNFADRFIVFLQEKDNTQLLPAGKLSYQAIIVYEETIIVFNGYAPLSDATVQEFRSIVLSIKKK